MQMTIIKQNEALLRRFKNIGLASGGKVKRVQIIIKCSLQAQQEIVNLM